MSDSKQIADHGSALDIYFNEMLVDSTDDNAISKTKDQVVKSRSNTLPTENKPFQALLLDINGLQLAIPTEDIQAILPWPEMLLEQNQNTSDNETIMGFYTHAANRIKIINTAHIILPLQHRQNLATPSFLIMVGEDGWALSCHKINAVITLSPNDIHWRKNVETRPWLAGTSIKKSCSIINVRGLVDSLNS